MPYIGRGPAKSGAFRILDDFSASFDGNETTFALTVGSTALTVGLPETLIIAVDGVIQEPGTGFTISGSNIVFGSAPQDSATFWGVELGDVGGIADNIVDGKITTAKLASGVLDTDISSVSGSDDTVASAKAIKTYVDAQVATENQISEMNDVTLSSIGSGEILKWNGSAWINNTLAEAGITSTSPAGNAGSIQFSDGSAFAADNGQLHWDATNNRLGIGTASPAKPLHIYLGSSGASARATSMLVLEDDTTDEIGIQFLMPGTSGTPQQSIFFGDAADGTRGRIIYDHIDDMMRIGTAGTDRVKIDSNGYMDFKTIACNLFVGSNQNVTSGDENHKIQWTSTRHDAFTNSTYTNGMHHTSTTGPYGNNTYIYAPLAGWYIIGAQAAWQGDEDGARRVQIMHNNSVIAIDRFTLNASSPWDDPRHQVTVVWYCNAGDYIQVEAAQYSGVTRYLIATHTHFWMAKIG